MGDFIIGPIRIVDNGDGIYREPIKNAKSPQDQITDPKGKILEPGGAEAQAALKQLGISSFQGLRLSPASRYLTALDQAQGYASSGDTQHAQEQLLGARLAASEAQLPFAEKRAESILNQSLLQELDSVVARGKNLAARGDVLALQDTFAAGRELLSRLGVPLDQAKAKGLPFTPDQMLQLEYQAYSQALPEVWKRAETASQAGNVPRTQESIAKIRGYAARANQTPSVDEEKKLTELERAAYERSVDYHLSEAASFALQGDVGHTRFHIAEAEDASALAAKPLDARRKKRILQMLRTALYNAPNFFFAEAELRAEAGDVEAVRERIQLAEDCRAQIGSSLNKKEAARARALEQKALQLSVDVLLGKASAAVSQVKKDGNIASVLQKITQARENAAVVKTAFSAAQETSAVNIRSLAYEAAVIWRFNQAEKSANLGKVDDTIVPLNAGRELAKQGSVNFDETRAAALIDTGLLKGIDLEFEVAEKFAKSGDKKNTYLHLETARDNARRLAKSFDEARVSEILKLLPPP